MDFDLQTSPFKLALSHKGASSSRPRRRWGEFFLMPDSAYRRAARKIIARQLAEKRELRRRIVVLEATVAAIKRGAR